MIFNCHYVNSASTVLNRCIALAARPCQVYIGFLGPRAGNLE